MGSSFDSWDGIEGAYYMGAGTSWEVIWLVISIALCIGSLYVGAKHELDAYQAVEKE